MNGFEAFWAAYPRKIGKLAAMKAYEKALLLASAEEIMAGVERYSQHLPDERQFICHASTFLNQGRWMDEYDEPAVKPKVDRWAASLPEWARKARAKKVASS